MDLPTGMLIGLVLFILFIAIYERIRMRREEAHEKMCLHVLRSTEKTHHLLVTEGCAKRCALSETIMYATLQGLFRRKLIYGHMDDDQFWYWKITDKGKKTLD